MKIELLPEKMKIPKGLLEKRWPGIFWMLSLFLIFFSFPIDLIAGERELPDGEKISLINALHHLSKDYQVFFSYDQEIVQGVEVNFEPEEYTGVTHALDEMLNGTSLKYKMFNNRYIILYEQSPEALSSLKGMVEHLETVIDSEEKEVVYRNRLSSITPLPSKINRFSIKSIIFSVSGKVTDENNEPLIGVNIQVKGTNRGTTTDFDGNFTIEDIDENAILIVSYIGFQNQEISISGKSTLTLVMVPDSKVLDEVIVTALGIEKENKSLGYAASQVGADEISINRSSNFMNSLTGKLPGVNISSLGTGPGGTSKIRIRGQSSISANNSPLIVINGIPMDNTNFGASDGGSGSTADGGDGLSSINPDDIENMTILKGAAASALYGSRAKDGVIMITTKTRGESSGIGVSYNMNLTYDDPLDYTDWQYVYGQGEHGVRPTTPNTTSGQWSFGEKIEPGMTYILFDGIEVPYEPQKNIIKEFYRVGSNFTNTLTLSSNGMNGGMHLSLSNIANKGIVPNNSFKRYIANLGFDYDLTERLSFSGSFNYSNEGNNNPPNIAEQDNTIPNSIYSMANTMPMDVLRDNRYDEDGNEATWSRFTNRTNPYWVLSDQFNTISRDRLIGNLTLRYKIIEGIFLQGRIGQDYWSRDQEVNNFPTGQASRPPAPDGFVNGVYTQNSRRMRELNMDLLLTANKQIGQFGLDASLGGNQMKRVNKNNNVSVTDFVVRDLYTVQNGRSKNPSYSLSERGVNSVYGTAGVSYRSFLYLNGTLRNDWFSTLSHDNRSILYPSISASYVFSENFGNSSNWFGKLRAAYAEVGSDTDVGPYSDVLFYSINSNLFPGPSGAFQPVGGSSGNTVPNPALRPMRISESEFGLEMRLFEDKFKFDLSYYHKITRDQIISAQISDASGFTNTRINSGESMNKGFELLLDYSFFRKRKFQWQTTFVSAYNKSKVLSLLTDQAGESITVGSNVFNGELRQVVGEEIGQIAGFGFKMDENGQRIFGDNGLPIRTDDLILFGSPMPKWTGGITNAFSYKKLTFSFLIDFKLGNKILSGTNFNAVRHGLHKMTLEGREGGVIGEGVDLEGNKNTHVAPVQTYWEVIRSSALIEPVVYNAGYWKLRQITLGFDLSEKIHSNFIKGMTLSLIGNNVFLLKKWIDNIDPDSFGYASDNINGMEAAGLPTTRSLGINLNLKF